jgi:ubiquitin C-terminal hydrolase
MAEKGSPYYRNFPMFRQPNINDPDSDSHAITGLQNSDVICYLNSILQEIESFTHLNGILSESTK